MVYSGYASIGKIKRDVYGTFPCGRYGLIISARIRILIRGAFLGKVAFWLSVIAVMAKTTILHSVIDLILLIFNKKSLLTEIRIILQAPGACTVTGAPIKKGKA
jgi:hypothetical protein